MKAKDYRRLAHEQCVKYSGPLAIIQLFIELFAIALALIGLVQFSGNKVLSGIFAFIEIVIGLVVSGPLSFAIVHICQKVKGEEKPVNKDLLYGFSRFSQAFIVDLLKTVFIVLWTLLLIVPGIIKTYSYALSEYISYDDPTISANDAITKSRQLMVGNKWKLFCLEISYIGWIILCAFTLGILGLWVMPKINQAKYNFYLNLVATNAPASKAKK